MRGEVNLLEDDCAVAVHEDAVIEAPEDGAGEDAAFDPASSLTPGQHLGVLQDRPGSGASGTYASAARKTPPRSPASVGSRARSWARPS